MQSAGFSEKEGVLLIQLKFTVDGNKSLRGDMILDIQTVERDEILLVGYQKNTRFGFWMIGQCFRKLHAKKSMIPHRINTDFLIGLNDYANWDAILDRQPAFDYYAASEVSQIGEIPKGTQSKRLPASKYIVFTLRAKSEDSLQPVADYIYKEWFPQSTCQLKDYFFSTSIIQNLFFQTKKGRLH